MRISYFAYGSNMLSKRLQKRVPSANPIGKGVLEGFVLQTNKLSRDGSSKCNVMMKENKVVHGVLFSIDAGERALLDKAEGLGHGYEICEADILCAQRVIPAFFYIAQEEHRGMAEPFEWYMNFARAGAHEHMLPLFYQQWLRDWKCQRDFDTQRREGNRDIIREAQLTQAEGFDWF